MSTTEERIGALRAEHARQLARASRAFADGKCSIAAIASQNATNIARELSAIESQLGNMCSTFRLLEWASPPSP